MAKWLQFSLILALMCLPAQAGDRLRVAIPSPEQEKVGDLLETLATAVTAEDYPSYLACLTDRARKGERLPAEAFVASDLELQVGKWVIESSTPSKIRLVLAYTLTRDGQDQRFVSTVDCLHSADRLLIDSEKSKPLRSANSRSSETVAVTCKDGRCAVVAPPPPSDTPRAAFYLFNNADGTPDPNGPMWLDPRKLIQAFPEKHTPLCPGGCNPVPTRK